MKDNPSQFYINEDGKTKCLICPHFCILLENQHGKCRVRQGEKESIKLCNYGQLVCASVDTIRKRPIYLWPDDNISSLSVGLTGCNNFCPFCQNHMVSQTKKWADHKFYSPKDLIEKAKFLNVDFISFTYTEPIVWMEYFLDVSSLAKKNKLKVCVKSAGYISEGMYDIFSQNIDAINVDIKPMSEEYQKLCGINKPQAVWDFLGHLWKKRIHVEISHIIIEGVNDTFSAIQSFIDKLKETIEDEEMGIHLLRHYPAWKSNYRMTSDETLERCKKQVLDYGYKNVYIDDVG